MAEPPTRQRWLGHRPRAILPPPLLRPLYAGAGSCAARLYGAPFYKGTLAEEAAHGRSLSGRRRGSVRRLRPLRRSAEEDLMIVDILYIVATVGVAIYMLVALIGPETF
jgi:hypothetical protein